MLTKFAVFFALFVKVARSEGCNITSFTTWPPVIFGSDTLDILYPPIENLPDNRNITLPIGATIIISCNGGYFQGDNYKTTKTILATCNQDSQLEVQDTILDLDTLNCVNFDPILVKVTSTSCGPNAILIELGFQIGLNIKFVPQNKICFDLENLIPLYSNYNLTKSIGFIKSYLVTPYEVDNVYNVSVDFDLVYNNFSVQQQQINQKLGLPADSTKYVNPVSCNPSPGLTTPGFCFSKRPLAYRGDFVYLSQQYATYRYINVAPQWYFIDYNLDKLERNVIDYARNKKVDLEVYTGTFGVATLPHATTGEDVELFLHVDENTEVIPLPLIFWKLVYDPLIQNASVFLTINNPHLNEEQAHKYVICEDISDEMQWLTWEKHNATKGFSYACSYDDAKAHISYLPDILVKGILI